MPINSIFYTLPYVLVFLILTFLAIPITTNPSINNETRRVQEQYAFLILFIFLGLRGFIYSDWYSYYGAFEETPTLRDSSKDFTYFFSKSTYAPTWERGFCMLLILCKSIIPQWWFFQSVCFLLNIVVDILFIKSLAPKHIVLGLCFYFVFGGMRYDINLMRNSKAIMFFIISLRYAADKKIFLYMILNLLGTLFHTSALIYLPLYFLLYRKPNKYFLWILFIMGNILYLFQIRWCMPIVAKVAELIGGRTAMIAGGYLTNVKWTTSYGISIGYLERTATFILAMKYKNKFLESKYNTPVLHCMYIYILSYLFLSEMNILTSRIPALFMFAYWPLYPQIYEWLNKERKIIFVLIFILYAVMKIISGGKALPNVYDNILFPKYTLNERKYMLERSNRFLDTQTLGGGN